MYSLITMGDAGFISSTVGLVVLTWPVLSSLKAEGIGLRTMGFKG